MSSRADVGDLDNSLPSWVSEHLGEKSFRTDKVNEFPSSPLEESFDFGEDPEMENRPPPEREEAGVLRVPRTWSTLDSSHLATCPSIIQVWHLVSGQSDVSYFQAFRKCFTLGRRKMAFNGEDNAEDKSIKGTTQIAGDEGESYHSRDEPHYEDKSRGSYMEYLGTIKKIHRRILPHLSDKTLLTLLGAKCQLLVRSLELSSSSSSLSSNSEAWSDPRLPLKLRSDNTDFFLAQIFYLVY
ncbi:hypothetical protein Acr_13g0015960 [Actinidia rufa]|uniref:Uncharacterized protein n=1 Tax=Actinidia rufa TaxID=165716 RepID=A0A7J0FP67_9ERIC|nr:hypothetical protein Acr_13g0015960 [Actinidia rufa]